MGEQATGANVTHTAPTADPNCVLARNMLRGSFEISCQACSSSSDLQVATQRIGISLPSPINAHRLAPHSAIRNPRFPLGGKRFSQLSLILRHFLHEFSQTFKKRLGLDQVGRAEALGELIINRLQ